MQHDLIISFAFDYWMTQTKYWCKLLSYDGSSLSQRIAYQYATIDKRYYNTYWTYQNSEKNLVKDVSLTTVITVPCDSFF